MSKFDFNDYKKKQEEKAKETTSTERQVDWDSLPKTQFMNQLFKDNSNQVVVRFPYHTSKDFHVEHVHEVVFPGSQYPQKVECTMDDTGKCALCESKTKRVDRFLVKAIAYITKGDKVELVPVVWDRPMKYAEELAGKMTDYGDLTECLFRIKKMGEGQNTTYSTDIITNKQVYSPEIYKADFSILEHVSPDKILVRRMSKYLEAVGEKTEPKVEESVKEDAASTELRSTGFGYSEEVTDPTMGRPKRYSYN